MKRRALGSKKKVMEMLRRRLRRKPPSLPQGSRASHAPRALQLRSGRFSLVDSPPPRRSDSQRGSTTWMPKSQMKKQKTGPPKKCQSFFVKKRHYLDDGVVAGSEDEVVRAL